MNSHQLLEEATVRRKSPAPGARGLPARRDFDPQLLQPQRNGASVWLRVGTLLDGTSAQPLRQADLVYDARLIRYVGASSSSPPPALLNPGQREPDLELPDYVLLPGLIEAHAHLFLEGGELDPHLRAAALKQTRDTLLTAAKGRLEKLVRLGVTAVRDAGDKDGVGLALSKLYQGSQRPLMPYVDSPGAAIHRKGRYGSFMADSLENFPTIRDCVQARIQAGADRIKLIPTGIINFQKAAVTSEPQMTAAEVFELVQAAKDFGKQTFAHASGDAGIDRVIDGGVDSIEHGFFVREDQLARMRDRQIGWVPTFAPVQAQVDHAERMGWDGEVVSSLRRILEQHAAMLVKAQRMGVLIIAGSDAGSYGVAHGTGLLRELEFMERAGLSSLSVINAATGVSSNRLGYREKIGQVRPGYASRFILTKHSPLVSISNLKKHRYVLYDGNVLEADEQSDVTGL